jgi:EAL domain-containing protein (putative c-di-GMP-specific phosphodiesterase class I)/ActR/RegA family two-component response regulator
MGDTSAQGRERGANRAGAVLVVDDEPAIARATERALSRSGYQVTIAAGGREAIRHATAAPFDAILSDLAMPDMDGRQLLKAIRARDLDVPFIFFTGSPNLQSAIEAVEYGAFRYLLKPVPLQELLDVVNCATSWHRLAVLRREAAAHLEGGPGTDRAGLEARFAAALDSLSIVTQPIVSSQSIQVLAYEALVRNEEPTLRNPTELFDVAERLARTSDLGRAIRRLVGNLLPKAPESVELFVNLHPSDLTDDELFSHDGALTPFARRVVLEITERAALDEIPGLAARIARLRALGFRIAVDDLGAGYAGLSSFAALEPDVIKADMSLVRGIDASPIKQKLIAAIATLANDLQIHLVAEGIETPAERDCVVSLGAHALQGYLFARPGRGFPSIVTPCD